MTMLVSGYVTFSQAKVEVGLKAGANFSNFSTDANSYSLESSTGLAVGTFVLFKVANIGIQPEVLYSLQGATIEDATNSIEQEMHYITVPVMAKVYLPLGLNIQAGPQYGLLLSAKADEEDVKEEFKNSDISLGFGLGWDLPFGLKVSGRYYLGLNDINETGGEELKNRNFQIALGYSLFKLGR